MILNRNAKKKINPAENYKKSEINFKIKQNEMLMYNYSDSVG